MAYQIHSSIEIKIVATKTDVRKTIVSLVLDLPDIWVKRKYKLLCIHLKLMIIGTLVTEGIGILFIFIMEFVILIL